MYFRRDFRQADNCLSLMSFFVCKMRTNLSTLWDFLSMRNKVSERHTMFLGEDDDSFKLLLFSCLVMPDSLWPHGLQHVRLPCPSPTTRACSNSCLLSQWCHPIISSSFVPFSSCLQSFLASGYFPMTQFFASGGQSIGTSTSASVLPVNFQGWFPLGLTVLIYLLSKGLSSLLQHHSSKASILQLSAFFMVQLSHAYMITGKSIALIIQTFVGKVMYLLFNMLSRLP